MIDVKVSFTPSQGVMRNQFVAQTGLAVTSWSDECIGKNIFYLYDNGVIDEKLLSIASLVICSEALNDTPQSKMLIVNDIDYINDGSVISVNSSGKLRVLFNPKSTNNALFVTDACNNFCVMCPQPPKPIIQDDAVEHLNDVVSLIRKQDAPEVLGITGGEPTTIKAGLINVLKNISEKFPDTIIQLLSNGRLFSYRDFALEMGQASEKMFVCVPLFGATSDIHDYIVQSKGAFDRKRLINPTF